VSSLHPVLDWITEKLLIKFSLNLLITALKIRKFERDPKSSCSLELFFVNFPGFKAGGGDYGSSPPSLPLTTTNKISQPGSTHLWRFKWRQSFCPITPASSTIPTNPSQSRAGSRRTKRRIIRLQSTAVTTDHLPRLNSSQSQHGVNQKKTQARLLCREALAARIVQLFLIVNHRRKKGVKE